MPGLQNHPKFSACLDKGKLMVFFGASPVVPGPLELKFGPVDRNWSGISINPTWLFCIFEYF